MSPKQVDSKILKVLEKQDMTIEEVAMQIGMNRVTVSKYLAVLEARGQVRHREIGKAKLYSLKGKR